MIGTLSLILIMSKLTEMEAFNAKKIQPADPLAEDQIFLQPEDIYSIKAREGRRKSKEELNAKMHNADPLTEERLIADLLDQERVFLKSNNTFRIKKEDAFNGMIMQPTNPLTENRAVLKPDDVYSIKAKEGQRKSNEELNTKMHNADPLTKETLIADLLDVERVFLKSNNTFSIKKKDTFNEMTMQPTNPLTEQRYMAALLDEERASLISNNTFRIKEKDELNAMKMQPTIPVTENRVVLKPEDVNSFVHSMNRPKDVALKDPGSYCRAFKNCYECVKSLRFPCGWCHAFGCTDSPAQLCPGAETKAEKSNITGIIKACPYAEHDGPIMVPEGVSTNIKVKLYGLDPAVYANQITCQIKIGSWVTDLKGVIHNKVVYCYPVILQPKLNGDKGTGALTLKWGGAEPNSNQIPLILYNCEVLASNCEECAKMKSEYRCGWCYPVSKCTLEEECDHSRLKWIRDSWSCDKGRLNRGYRRFKRGNSRR